MGRKIYVRPKAKKVEPKKVKKVKGRGGQTREGRERQKAAARAYWARWREEHGKNPVTLEQATKIVKENFAPETPRENAISDEARQMFRSVGEKFGYALGKSFGDAMVEGIRSAQAMAAERRKGTPADR